MSWLKRKRPKPSLSTEDEINENYFDLVTDNSLSEMNDMAEGQDNSAIKVPAAQVRSRQGRAGRIREVSPNISGRRFNAQNTAVRKSPKPAAAIDLTHAVPRNRDTPVHVLDLAS